MGLPGDSLIPLVLGSAVAKSIDALVPHVFLLAALLQCAACRHGFTSSFCAKDER